MIILAGKSGSGKTTVTDYLVANKGFKKIVTCTTRPMREGEIDGKDYIFLTEKEFLSKARAGEFAETAEYNASFGHCYYGSLKKDYEDTGKNIIILNPKGLRMVQKAGVPAKSVFIDVSDDELHKRLSLRGDDKKEIVRRLDSDAKDFAGINTDVVIHVEAGTSVAEIADRILAAVQ